MRRNYELFFFLIVAAVGFALFLFAERASAATPKLGRLVQTRQYSQTLHGHKYACVEADYTRGFALACTRLPVKKQPAKGAS